MSKNDTPPMVRALHFKLEELVDYDTFYTFGDKAWMLLHPDALAFIDGVREFFEAPVTVNDWLWDGLMQYRGYRPPHCMIGAQGSYHKRGKAFDFNVKNLTAEQVRKRILSSQENHLLCKINRMEADVDWVHADLGEVPEGKKRIYLFRA